MAQDKDLYYLVELYTPKARWHALPAAERQAFLAAVGGALTELAALGVHVISLAPTEAGIDHGSPHRFLGIWSFPDRAARDALLAGIAPAAGTTISIMSMPPARRATRPRTWPICNRRNAAPVRPVGRGYIPGARSRGECVQYSRAVSPFTALPLP